MSTIMAATVVYLWALSLSVSLCVVHSMPTTHVYLVYLGHHQNQDPVLTSRYHLRLLATVFTRKEDAEEAMVYSYKHGLSGFSAKLNSSQAAALAGKKGVISVFKSKSLELHTTRSWDFLGLTLDYDSHGRIPLQLVHGDEIVVGVLDTGVWPELKSFQEEPGMRPIPRSWKGKCVSGEMFDPTRDCNRKLIGARYYIKGYEQQYGKLNKTTNPDYLSPRDYLGHGTHIAATAVGSVVKSAASFFGFGRGTARGGAPRARLAVYKACWNKDLDGICTEADVMAAFDDALHDGVDVISASFGLTPPLLPFFVSAADIGAFHAMQMGVSVVFSAGNSGPEASLVGNVSPWSICVAASSIDRTFPTQIILDNNVSFMGESLVSNGVKARLAGASSYFYDGVCKMENWKNRKASGRVILCFATIGSVLVEEAEAAAWRANASGLIFVEPLGRPVAYVTIIPVVRVDLIQGTQIGYYLAQSSKLPVIQILPSSTVLRKSPAPIVADFSSRGPSSISPDFLKPDISAPGVNILAAWPPNIPPTFFPTDRRSTNWNFQSGTSMSCPHVSGVVALIKSIHQDWSPAAIRSALITTAYNKDTSGDSILAGGSLEAADPFDVGAGHINPLKAIDPGLVYDMKTKDYIAYLCNIGYTEEQIRSLVVVSAHDAPCSCRGNRPTTADLNYPSITIINLQRTTTIRRTARNVGRCWRTAIYTVKIVSPNGVDVWVWPRVLVFTPFKQELTYYVSVRPKKASQGRYDFGEIVWSDGFHRVRSPLVILVTNSGVWNDIDESTAQLKAMAASY
ncbi:subtilisin-like protease SBT3.18 [Ipomoea triloba]|uniref:subtilisin-like protease SBT3.18 n=1 Tax=Ipomoea triloba TaxID=35885 RepID=UPI00125D1C91|nr:subtilisin-like protease SBT3.18 [Ipomoea triloba]